MLLNRHTMDSSGTLPLGRPSSGMRGRRRRRKGKSVLASRPRQVACASHAPERMQLAARMEQQPASARCPRARVQGARMQGARCTAHLVLVRLELGHIQADGQQLAARALVQRVVHPAPAAPPAPAATEGGQGREGQRATLSGGPGQQGAGARHSGRLSRHAGSVCFVASTTA